MMVDYVKELRVGNKQSALADYIEQLQALVGEIVLINNSYLIPERRFSVNWLKDAENLLPQGER